MIGKLTLALIFLAGNFGTAAASPDWLRLPTGNDVVHYYPEQARLKSIGGRAVISCKVSADLHVEACTVISEDPPGFGFGDAAIKLSKLFIMKPNGRDGTPAVIGASVTLPIRFEVPEPEPGQPAATPTP